MKTHEPPMGTAATHSTLEQRGSLALDQWRGLALIMVLVSHGFYFTGRVHGIGRVGVNLFFFISGILVFRSLSHSRLSDPMARTKSFWWRRLRRLYPAMLSYVTAMFLVTLALPRLMAEIPLRADIGTYCKWIPAAVGYAINYVPEGPMAFGHLWSLGCEMQFYMLAPLIYLAGGAPPIRRNVVFGIILFILLALGISQPFIGKWKYHFEFAVWPMMLGFCSEYKRAWFQNLPGMLVTWMLWASIAVCAASSTLMIFGYDLKTAVVATGALLLVPCYLAYLYGRPMPGVFGETMRWCGERTYSIYLWQQPFTICNFLPNFLHPFGALCAIPIGGIWFRFFEYPFLSTSRQKQENSR